MRFDDSNLTRYIVLFVECNKKISSLLINTLPFYAENKGALCMLFQEKSEHAYLILSIKSTLRLVESLPWNNSQ